ncbi:MAG: STAS domain-containing protein [Alistipes sp.]|nr:STAS domain-containing protein [Alistipes sp.]
MEITIRNCENQSIVLIVGRLDTNTAPELEAALNGITAKEVVLDCSSLEYVSSAGLRVILASHKHLMAAEQRLTLRNICTEVRSVLDMTGFSRILFIE